VDDASWTELAPSGAAAAASNWITFEVDATAPNAYLSVVCGGVISCVGGIAYATQTVIPLALSATDAHNVTTYALGNGLSGNAAQTDAWDGGSPVVSGTFSPASTTVSLSPLSYPMVGAVDGVNYIAVLYQDAFGNWCCAGQTPVPPFGNQSAVSVSLVLDLNPPTFTVVTATPNPAGAPGGIAQTVTMTISGFDNTSGLGTAPTVTVTQNNGPTVVATFIGCSQGLSSPGSAPVASQPGNVGVGSVTGEVTCTFTYVVTATATTDGPALIAVSGYDRAGWLGTATGTFTVDTQPPLITPYATLSSVTGTAYVTGEWTSQTVYVQFDCNDLGVGLDNAPQGCQTSVDGDGTTTATGGPANGGVTVTVHYAISTDTTVAGSYVTATAQDKSTNTNSATFGPVRVDKTPPTIVSSVPAPTGNNGWYKTDVPVTFGCTDVLSGITTNGCTAVGAFGSGGAAPGGLPVTGPITVSTTWTITQDTTGTVATGTAIDQAYNSASTTSVSIKRDVVTPTSYIYRSTGEATIHAARVNAAELASGALDWLRGEAYDATSGVVSVSITIQRSTDNAYWNPNTDTWGALAYVTTTLSAVSPTRTWQTVTGDLPTSTSSATNGWTPATYTVISYAEDEAGWIEGSPTGAPASGTRWIQFEVDAQAPTGLLSIVCGGFISCVGGFVYATGTAIPLSLTASDAHHNVQRYAFGDGLSDALAQSYAWNGGLPTATFFTTPSTTVSQSPVTYNLATTGGGDGTFIVAVLYEDEFGNWCCAGQSTPHVNQTAVTASVIIDQTPPSFTVVSATPDPAGAPGGIGQLVTITITGYDLTSGLGTAPTVTVTQQGTAFGTSFVSCAPPGIATPGANPVSAPYGVGVTLTCTYTYTVQTNLDGIATITATGRDRAGWSTTAYGSFVIDTPPP
jgi:hypothetical protein